MQFKNWLRNGLELTNNSIQLKTLIDLLDQYLYIITWFVFYWAKYVPNQHVSFYGLDENTFGQGTYEGQCKTNHVIIYLLYDLGVLIGKQCMLSANVTKFCEIYIKIITK